MMTPKEALIKDGTVPVKEGRGRMSREAVERVKWLVAEKGWVIKDYPAPKKHAAEQRHDEARKPAAPVEVKRVAGNGADVVKEFTIFWPEESFKAVGLDKKEHGMREVCNTCRVSLVQNQCANPTILGGIRVNIVPR
jgi:hypothetical protein